MEHIYDAIILGGGPAGYTAAMYCARAGLDTLILEKLSPGGQMALTTQIDNYPGFPQGVDGFALGEQMQEGAERFGAQTLLAEVLSVALDQEVKTVETSEGTFYTRGLILATGAHPKKLGIPGEQALVGRGVAYCAHCDGMFYRGKTVVVVGGGNSAAADALVLSRICEKVIVVHRRDTLRATKIYHAPLMQAENVEFRWNSSVSRFVQGDRLEGVMIQDVHTGEEQFIKCDGVFVSIGRSPATELVQGQLSLDGNGYVLADETTRTNLPGVFAAGDVRTKQLRQVVTAVADGASASHALEEYLSQISVPDEI